MNLNFCPNLTLMYPQVPFLERFGLAKAQGFSAVEFQFPYEYGLEAVREKLTRTGLACKLFNLDPSDRAAGEFGTLSLPGRRDFFRSSFERALSWAYAFGCPRLNLVYGNALPGVSQEAQQESAVENLAWALPLARNAGVVLLLEPLNPIDMPRALLNTTLKAVAIIQSMADPNLRLQFDFYHCVMMYEELPAAIMDNYELFGHLQLADVPGRHEPGTGYVDFKAAFGLLEQFGYTGWIGLEYVPAFPESHDPRLWLDKYRDAT